MNAQQRPTGSQQTWVPICFSDRQNAIPSHCGKLAQRSQGDEVLGKGGLRVTSSCARTAKGRDAEGED